jgi:flagellar hook assembly protein FlgD
VRLEVCNLLGQRVRTLIDGPLERGRHRIIWSGQDDDGERVASGVYFCRMTAGEAAMTRKMVLLR